MDEIQKADLLLPMKNSQLPITSIFRQGFQREVLRDLQDFLYSRLRRPSVVVIPLESGKLYPCFPRKLNPIPDELFHHLVDLTATLRHRAIIERYELDRVKQLLDLRPQERKWGWHRSPLGLADFYSPIYIADKPGVSRVLLAVLVFGKYWTGDDLRSAHQWIDEVISASPELRVDQVARLHELANKLPILDPRTRSSIEADISSSVELTEIFLSRALHAGSIFKGEGLIGHLGLEKLDVHITTDELWSRIQEALQRLSESLNLTSAVAFWASHREYSEMKRMVSVPSDLEGVDRLPLASPEEFEWLHGESWVNIPTQGPFFSWLLPRTLLGSEYGALFGREMIGGNIVVFAFGYGPERLAPFQRAALYDAMVSRVYQFLDNAWFGIELDHLMAETGHLMGRAVGKVTVGVKTLQRMLGTDFSRDDEKYKAALWAIEDGQVRLELIQHNFYSFPTRRRKSELISKEVSTPNEDDARERLDVVEVVKGMQSFFNRAVLESGLKPMVYQFGSQPAMVVGDRNALRLTLLNLFDNALKFSYMNTYIVVDVTAEDDLCRVVFRNLGVGVAKNERRSVFRAFTKSRYKNPYKRIEGLGLGLSYCRWVVEDIFGGRISLASGEAQAPKRKFEGDNWLTTVTMLIPLERLV